MRTLSNLQAIELGFNREHVLLFELNARQAGHRDPEILAFYDRLRAAFAAIPGVRAVTLSHASLLNAGRGLDIQRLMASEAPDTRILNTGPDFFSTMQIPMLLGRELDERDTPGSAPVVVANQKFAALHFGMPARWAAMSLSAVPIRVKWRSWEWRQCPLRPIEGRHPARALHPLQPGRPPARAADGLRPAHRRRSARLRRHAREIVRQAESAFPWSTSSRKRRRSTAAMNQEIVFARLCTGFAALALIIACIGLYGTMSYTVARRTGEIGIRMALGAQRGVVVRMILRRVIVLAAAGMAIGVPAALFASRLVASFLFGMKANDPRALLLAAAILFAAALLAGYVPARKASRIDPATAIRNE